MTRRAFLTAAGMGLWDRPILGELLELPARHDSTARDLAREARALRVL